MGILDHLNFKKAGRVVRDGQKAVARDDLKSRRSAKGKQDKGSGGKKR